MANRPDSPSLAGRLALGFLGGFLATLLFHQVALMILVAAGVAKAGTYSMQAVPPFGVPQVLSLSFWGGLWGMVFASFETKLPKGAGYWLAALLFGALGPTLVAWFVVAPLKGQPLAAGWQASRMITGLVINGAWGIGTALLLAAFFRMRNIVFPHGHAT